MAWSLEAEAEFSKIWDDLLLLGPLHLGRAEVTRAIEIREETVQQAGRETANPHQDELTRDDTDSSSSDDDGEPPRKKMKIDDHINKEAEDIEKKLMGWSLYTQHLRKEITMTQFMKDYMLIMNPQVDEYVDKHIPKHI